MGLFQPTFVHFQVGIYFFSMGLRQDDSLTPWPCGWPRVCHKISAWAESKEDLLRQRPSCLMEAGRIQRWKMAMVHFPHIPWCNFLTPKKHSALKDFLRESRLRKLGALLSFEFMSPAPPKKTSLSRDRLQVGETFGLDFGLGIPLCFAQGETELIGKLFERVGIRVFRVGRARGWIPMGVDDGRIWDTIDDERTIGVGWSIFWILEWKFLPGWSKLFLVHSDGEGRTRTWYLSGLTKWCSFTKGHPWTLKETNLRFAWLLIRNLQREPTKVCLCTNKWWASSKLT